MEKEGFPTPLERLAELFRQRRFSEAMEFLDTLPREKRARLGIILGERFPNAPLRIEFDLGSDRDDDDAEDREDPD